MAGLTAPASQHQALAFVPTAIQLDHAFHFPLLLHTARLPRKEYRYLSQTSLSNGKKKRKNRWKIPHGPNIYLTKQKNALSGQ